MALLSDPIKKQVDTIIQTCVDVIDQNQPQSGLDPLILADRAEVVSQYTVYLNLAKSFYSAPLV